MLEIKTKGGKCLISESGVIGIQRGEYYPHEDHGYYSMTIQYQMGMTTLEFKTLQEANEALDYIKDNISGISDSSTGKEEYVKGFKDGVEYALKLKGKCDE